MNLEQRLELVKRGTVEIIQRSELDKLLVEKMTPRAYWGFECSGTQACTARNDAHRPRSCMCLQDSRPDQSRVPLHNLPGRLAFDDQQQIRLRPREDPNGTPILQALYHCPWSPRDKSRRTLELA